MLSILAFIYGASIGSFSQVVASRLNVAPILKGRSKCLSCGEALRVSDLAPIFSYLFLRGKCRYCKSSYGVTALVIEMIYGATFLLLYQLVLKDQPTLLSSLLWLVYYTALFIVLGVMAMYDKAHSYIPAQFLWMFTFLTGIMYIRRLFELPSILVALSPLFVALPFLLIWIITKGKGLGFGDVLLFACVGAFFGSLQGFAVLMLSVWIGALYGIYLKLFVLRKKKGQIAIPFVPFIVIAFIIVLYTGINVMSFSW